jgi:hypothetical protein
MPQDEEETLELIESAVEISGAKESHTDDGLIWLTFNSHDEAVAALFTLGSTDRQNMYSLTRRPKPNSVQPPTPSVLLYVPHAPRVNILATLSLGGKFISATASKKDTFMLVAYTNTEASTAALAAIRKVIPKAAFSHSTRNLNSTTLMSNISPPEDTPAACAATEPAYTESQQSQIIDSAAFLTDKSTSDGEDYATTDEEESKPQASDDHKRHYQIFVCTTLVLSSEQLERHFSVPTSHTFYRTGTGFCADCLHEQLKQLT